MALVDALLDKISDRALRTALRKQVDLLLDKQQYGLVFQQHKPETVELYTHKVRKHCKVRIRSEADEELYRVDLVKAGKATITSMADQPETWEVDVDDLVIVREFGDPIYPGLESTGKVERGGDKPAHLVINAENFHALELLLYTHSGKIDAIYIDPPYNTRDRDWKYNNDYVDSDDVYRHSKWLAMMERRLKLAGQLLNPDDSVLIVTIDEKEYLRLGLLLEQTFKDARIQMISSNINPASASRAGAFGRSDEYIFVVMFGAAGPTRVPLTREWITGKGRTYTGTPRWDLLRRSGSEAARTDRPSAFYPIYVDVSKPAIVHVGNALPPGQSHTPDRAGCLTVMPLRKDGSEGRWMMSPEELRARIAQGRVRISVSRTGTKCVLYYLADGEYAKVQRGDYIVAGHGADGSLLFEEADVDAIIAVPSTQWRVSSHDATQYGSRLLNSMIPGRAFPFPKSLYAVEDILRFFVTEKPNAVILDFFAGSGTTLHAVARLNRQDGGNRRAICVTNNEVSDQEAKALANQGHRAGDPEWEAMGVCEYITNPRVVAALSGLTPSGEPIAGKYRFSEDFPMSEGFEANAEFFKLTYEDPDQIERGKRFEALAPVLWLNAGGVGERIEKPERDWALPDGAVYGVLFNDDKWRDFVDAVIARGEAVTHIYAVTESTSTFQQMLTELPSRITSIPLYSHYLDTFEINTKGRS